MGPMVKAHGYLTEQLARGPWNVAALVMFHAPGSETSLGPHHERR